MQSIATDVVWSVHLSVSCAEMAEDDFWAVDFGVVWILFFCVCNCLCVFCVCLRHFVSICLHLLCWVWLGRNVSLPTTGRGTFWGHTSECPDLAPVDILNVIQQISAAMCSAATSLL